MILLRRRLARAALALMALGCGGDSAQVTQLPAPGAASISFDISAAIVGVRASVQFTPSILDAQGHDITSVTTVEWKTSDASLATVDDTGAVTGVRLGGPVTITATANGHSASVVYAVTPARIEITPAVSTIEVATAVRFTGVPLDGLGQPIEAGTVVWSSSDAAIATVDQAGLVTGIGAGNALITATAAGKSSGHGVLVGVVSAYDGTFTSTTPNVQLTVVFGNIVHFEGTFAPLAICTVSVTAALNVPITTGAPLFQMSLNGPLLFVQFPSPNSATGFVSGVTPSQCMQGANPPLGLQYGNFVAHK